MYKTSSFIFFINISLLSLPFFLISSESPYDYPKEWEHLTVKEITKKYKKIAIEYCKKVKQPNETLVPMWDYRWLIVSPTETQEKIISTLGLNTCVAAMIHILFFDKTQFASLLHTSIDNTKNITHFARQYAMITIGHDIKPIKSIELFTSIPKAIDPNDHKLKELLSNPLYSKFESLMSDLIMVFKHESITATKLKHPSFRITSSFIPNDRRNLKMILHPTHSYLEQGHSTNKIPLLTDTYFEKIEKADYSLACKLIKEYNEKK